MSISVPIKILHEAEGFIVTCETATGEIYRGKLIEAGDNMNCHLQQVTITDRDGRVTQSDNVFLRGSNVSFFILPDMLKNAPVFRPQPRPWGMQRGRGSFFRGQGVPRGRGTMPTGLEQSGFRGQIPRGGSAQMGPGRAQARAGRGGRGQMLPNRGAGHGRLIQNPGAVKEPGR